MRTIRIERRAAQRLAARALGTNPRFERFWRGSVQIGNEAEHLTFPLDTDSFEALQASNGGLYFVAGISRISGGDLVAPVAGYDPDPVLPVRTDLTIHLDAALGTFQEAAFTTPATANNDPVGGWKDQSGNGNHFTNGGGSIRPLLQLAQVNSLPGVRFDDVNDYLDATVTLAKTFHAFLVMRQYQSNAGDNAPFIGRQASGSTIEFHANSVAGGYTVADGANLSDNSLLNSFTYCVVEVLASTGTSRIRVNDGAGSAGSIGAGGGSWTNPRLANNWNLLAPCAVDYAELAIYSAEKSGGDLTEIRSYLGLKYNISV